MNVSSRVFICMLIVTLPNSSKCLNRSPIFDWEEKGIMKLSRHSLDCAESYWLIGACLSTNPCTSSRWLLSYRVNFKLYPSPNLRLMKSDVPTAINCPLDIIPIRSASISASSKWWVVSMIVLLSYLIFSRISHMALLENASIPEVGSSRNMILESPTNAIANDSFLLEPPDNSATFLSYSNVRSVFSITSLSSSWLTYPLIPAINNRCSLIVNASYKQSFWVHNPNDFLI